MITRLAGADRYDTALAIAQFMQPGGPADNDHVFLATGTDFADALSAGDGAALDGGPLLLTSGSHLTPAVQAYVQAAVNARVVTVGGLAATAYPAAHDSYVGTDRYQTSELVAVGEFGRSHEVTLATGLAFPDALSGGAYAARVGAPLLLAPPSLTTTGSVPSYLHVWSSMIDRADIFGGTGVVSSTVETQLGQIIGLTADHLTITSTGPAHALGATLR
jgi:hypothetical protein